MIQIEIIYEKETKYFISFIVNETKIPKLILEPNQERKFIEINYPFSLLSEIEEDLNTNDIYLKPKFVDFDNRYYTKNEVDSLITDSA